jgi:hypothetical protein
VTFLDRVDARLIAASPRPWSYSTVDSIGGGGLYDATRTIMSVLHHEEPEDNDGRIVRYLPEHEADANGDLIAHAPEDIAALIQFAREVKEIVNDVSDTRKWQAGHVYLIEQALIRLEERP